MPENSDQNESPYERIPIAAGEPFFTDSTADAFRVCEGTVHTAITYISGGAPADTVISIGTFSSGAVFPGLAYQDMDYNRWTLRIEPEGENAALERMTGLATGLLRKRFCEGAGCKNYAENGFEGSLVDQFYASRPQRVVTNPEPLYTKNTTDFYRVIRGSVQLSVVPTIQGKRKKSRSIGVITEGLSFPAFWWEDESSTQWQFLVKPRQSSAILEIGKGMATEPLRTGFCRQYAPEQQAPDFLHTIRQVYLLEEERETECIARGQEYRSQIARKTVGLLWDAVHQQYTDPYSPDIDEHSTYAIVSYACRRGSIDLAPWERVAECFGASATVPEIAAVSNFVCREILLDANWYKSDCGVLIGRRGDQLVACVPKGNGRYVCYDGKSEGPVTARLAMQIDPKVYSLGRALPKTELTVKQLRQFCAKSVRRRDLVAIFLLGLLGTLLGILLPVLNQQIYDDYIPMGSYDMVIQMCMLIGTFMLSNISFSLVKKLAEFRVACRVEYDLQNAVYLRVFQFPERFFRTYDSADLAQRIQSAGPAAGKVAAELVGSGFSLLLSVLYLYQMFQYSGRLTGFALILLSIFALILFSLEKKTMVYEKTKTEESGKAASKLYQYLTAISKIRMAGAEERAIYEYLVPVTRKQQNIIKRNRFQSVDKALRELSGYLFAMVFYYVAIHNNIGISMGKFAGFNTAFGSFSAAVLQFMAAVVAICELIPVYNRLRPLMTAKPEDDGSKEAVQSLEGGVRFEHVSFAYSEEGGNVLHDVSFDIKPGEYVALVGPSGCGKSTVLKLLLGFETPQSGRVCYDGKDLRNLDTRSLRKKLGVVLQNGKLIAGSIYENITIIAPRIEPEKVERVLEAVGLKEDLAQMPMGVHTVLSEEGNTISGGQLQRILIARAIINEPRILYFDEATSALDNRTQAKVCSNLDRMHMTRVVIAHRLSTIRGCDRILVFGGGRIQEEGNYQELMAKGPGHMFYDMAIRQIAEDET